MKKTGVFLTLALLAGFSLAQYNGNVGVQTNSPANGTIFDVSGGPAQFTFDFTAEGGDLTRASLGTFRHMVRNHHSDFLRPTNESNFYLRIVANVPYQVILGVPAVSGDSTLPLSRYTLTFKKEGPGSVVVWSDTLDKVTSPTLVYTGTAGGTLNLVIGMVVWVSSNDLLPGTQTITIPLTVTPAP